MKYSGQKNKKAALGFSLFRKSLQNQIYVQIFSGSTGALFVCFSFNRWNKYSVRYSMNQLPFPLTGIWH